MRARASLPTLRMTLHQALFIRVDPAIVSVHEMFPAKHSSVSNHPHRRLARPSAFSVSLPAK